MSDRLRYTEDVNKIPPATEFLKRAFAEQRISRASSATACGWSPPAPELVRGRRVVVHNNLIGDVANMGAIYTDEDVVVDGDLVTGRHRRPLPPLRAGDHRAVRGAIGGGRKQPRDHVRTAGTAGATTTATAGTPAATGSGASVPASVERFAASSSTTAGGAATRTAAGSGSAAPVAPGTSASAVPGRRVEANMPAAAGPVGPTPIPPARTPPAGA